MQKNYGIGVMSGTSLDGLDVSFVELINNEASWELGVIESEMFAYTSEWKEALGNAVHLSPVDLDHLSDSFARFIAEKVKAFIKSHQLEGKVAFVASHGQTVFHEPHKGVTVQIGNGQVIANDLGLKVVSDFRIKDVLLGGQGAPLVPIGDKLLFSQYQACLNLGGFSNISFDLNGERIAFDIGPSNLPLNFMAEKWFGKSYDNQGNIARSGQLIPALFDELNDLPFYDLAPPKSLGTEWLNTSFMPLLKREYKPEDLMCTLVHHQAKQIIAVFEKYALKEVLVTGGGAYNDFLISLLKEQEMTNVVLPSQQIIEFKEAIIFAFLGLLRIRNEINTLKSVTGAKSNSSGGTIHFPQ